MFSSFVRRLGGALALSLLAATAAALGAEPSPAPSASSLPDIGRVTTSDRQDEPISKTSRPTFVVDRAAIVARGARTIAEALADVPGVELYRYGPFGGQAGYGIRGSTSEQTLVLLDGEPIATASSGSIDLGTLSTVGVQRVEVVESGASTLYGTSAVGGVINIITGVPRGTYLALSSGTLGDRDLRATAGLGKFGLAFERHVASNVYTYPSIEGIASGTRQNSDAQQSAARLSYAGTIGSKWSLRGSLGSDSISNGVPGGAGAAGAPSFLTPDARQHTAREDVRVALGRDIAGTSLSVDASASRHNLAYTDPGPTFGGESDTYDARSQISLRDVASMPRATLVSGLDLAREIAKLSIGVFGPPTNTTAALSQAALYSQFDAEVGHAARLNIGLRGEHDAPYGSSLLPSIGAVANVGHLRLAANANESFRAPTIVDLYYPGFGNAALKPERARNIDATASTDSVLGGASLGFFDRRAANLIVATSTPQNVAHASIQGLLATVRTRPSHGIVTSLSVTDLYRAIDTSAGPANGTRLVFSPVFQSTLQFQRALTAFNLGFGIDIRSLGGHRESQNSGVLVGAFTTVDAYVRLHVGPEAILSIRGSNIGDERYAPIFGYPAPGRRLDVELATQ